MVKWKAYWLIPLRRNSNLNRSGVGDEGGVGDACIRYLLRGDRD